MNRMAAAVKGALIPLAAIGAACGGPKPPSAEKARTQIDALAVPGRSLGVESFTDNDSLSVFAPLVFSEVEALLPLGPGAADPLIATFTDTKLDGTEDGDRVRALAAFVLEQWGASAALPGLRAYLKSALAQTEPPFFSIETATHAVAVLSGQTANVRGLYGYDEVAAVAMGAGSGGSALTVTTSKGNVVEHRHLIGPQVPPASWTADFNPGLVQARNEVFTMRLDGIAAFEDPIMVLEDATRSYDCHSFTFRREDTQLPDLTQRYHILGESVPTLLADEGYTDVTASPASWKPGDVVVFYKKEGGTPTHTGRLSFGGTGLGDPNLRFTSKWSVTLPVVNVSVRDCMKLYGKVVRVFSKVGQCAVEVRAGSYETCARRADGTIWCWGSNQFGQLGDGTTTDSPTPVQVQGLADMIALAVGEGFACAVKGDGTVWCWGQNKDSGALGDGTEVDRSTPVQVMGLSGVAQVATGVGVACARKQDGVVWCWGGSLGPSPVQMLSAGAPPNDPPPALAADDLVGGFGGFCAHATDGGLWGWDGQRGDFPGDSGSNWVVGSLSLPANGAYPVTSAMSSLTMPPTLLSGAARAAVVGRLHACVIAGGGAVQCWGVNDHGQLGRTTSSAGSYAIADVVAGLPSAAVDLAAGDDHTCARTSDGAVWCWGARAQVDAAHLRGDSNTPVQVMGLTALTGATAQSLAGGAEHACALTPDGIWCWGSNIFGQIGTGSDTPADIVDPARVALPCP